MSGLHGIAYTCMASPLTADALTAVLEAARRFNAKAGITGVLFHHGGRRFEYFEGPETAVRRAYAQIQASPTHRALHLLWDAPLPARHFESWYTGFCEKPENAFQATANDEWIGAMPLTRTSLQRSEPMSLVLSYWSRWVADQPPTAT